MKFLITPLAKQSHDNEKRISTIAASIEKLYVAIYTLNNTSKESYNLICWKTIKKRCNSTNSPSFRTPKISYKDN